MAGRPCKGRRELWVQTGSPRLGVQKKFLSYLEAEMKVDGWSQNSRPAWENFPKVSWAAKITIFLRLNQNIEVSANHSLFPRAKFQDAEVMY